MSVPLHNVEGAPGDGQWHGRTAVSTELPVRNCAELKFVLRRHTRMRATVSAQCMNALKNVRAVRWLSTLPAQIVKHSFNIMLSVSQSRIALSPGSSGVSGRDFRTADCEQKKSPSC